MLRFSPLAVAACLVGGGGLWLTRASMDVAAGAGGELRVAMFPSGVEFAALAVLALVGALLTARLLRTLARTQPRAALPIDPLLPLFSLILLTLPYLPWLPDAVPALRALAGPARYGLWIVVIGQSVWLAWDALARTRAGPRLTRGSALLSVAGLAALGGVGALLAGGPLYPSEDRHLAVMVASPFLGAAALVLAWRWAVRSCGSTQAATFAWIALAASAPFLLRSGAPVPEMTLAFVVVAALAWPQTSGSTFVEIAAHGLLIGAIPWLAPGSLTLWIALTLIVATRQRSVTRAIVPSMTSLAGLAVAVLATADGWNVATDPLVRLANTGVHGLTLGLLALAVDQEYGVLPYAPALLLAVPGVVAMWHERGTPRRQAAEMLVVLFAAALPAGGALWLGHGDLGGRCTAVLPVLLVSIAWWHRAAAGQAVPLAAGRVLALTGVAISAALVSVNAGLLALTRGDGSSQFLGWLAPSHDLVRLVPGLVAHRDTTMTPIALAGFWIAGALACAWLLRRLRVTRSGIAAPAALMSIAAACLMVTVVLSRTLESGLAGRIDPAARAESVLLTRFDARARPAAVTYDRWHTVAPDAVPALFTFEGRPGLRREPQPVRVLLNTRLSLPAGDYEVELHSVPNAALHGDIGLQVGRTGDPLSTWPVRTAVGEPWRHRFRLDVDASFVGFRGGPEIERAVDGVRVRPLSVLNTRERLDRLLGLPGVLAAARYGQVTAYFHGAEAYPEPEGFWVRGSSTLLVTLARDPHTPPAPLRLRLHPGASRNRIHLQSGAWRFSTDLQPGEHALVPLPVLDRVHKAALRIVTESGFVPAQTSGGSDRRLLGCWVEIVE